MVVAALPTVWIDRVGPVEGVDILAWDLDGKPERADDIEYVCMPYQLDVTAYEHLRHVPNLRTLQLLTAGYDHALPHLPEGVALSNGHGIHSAATAELALGLTLAMQRGVLTWFEGHRAQRWQQMSFEPGLAGRTVLVLGYGDIGAAIVRRLRPFDPARITAVASRARAGDDLVDEVHGIDELPTLLPEQDVVIVIVPLNDATTGLVDARFLAAMKDDALLVNVARGKVVDTDALVEACASGRVRAALDVTDPEPLPDGHPLFSTPGVLVSPHVGGAGDIFWTRAADLLRSQLRLLGAGKPVEHVVNG